MANKPMAADAAPDPEETYDEWFIRQVKQALVEADDPNTVWVPHEEVMRDVEARRQEFLTRLAKND
jgi:broad specificity phosphatase PhoE